MAVDMYKSACIEQLKLTWQQSVEASMLDRTSEWWEEQQHHPHQLLLLLHRQLAAVLLLFGDMLRHVPHQQQVLLLHLQAWMLPNQWQLLGQQACLAGQLFMQT